METNYWDGMNRWIKDCAGCVDSSPSFPNDRQKRCKICSRNPFVISGEGHIDWYYTELQKRLVKDAEYQKEQVKKQTKWNKQKNNI